MAQSDLQYVVDLPAALNPGRVSLRPLNAFCGRLLRCQGCGDHSARAALAACGHAFCSQCSVRVSQAELWCDTCHAAHDALEQPVEDTLLDRMKFACRCGHEGSLRDIRKHFWPPQADNDAATARHRPLPPTGRKHHQHHHTPATASPSHHDRHQARENQLNALGEHIERLCGELRQLGAATTTLAANVDGLELTAGSRGHNELWLPFTAMLKKFRDNGGTEQVHSRLFPWVGNGLSLATQGVILAGADGEPSFGVVHRITFGQLNRFEAGAFKTPHLIMGARLLDLDGKVVETSVVPTIQQGKPTSAFEKRMSESGDGGCGAHILGVAEIVKPGANIVSANGLVRVLVDAVQMEGLSALMSLLAD